MERSNTQGPVRVTALDFAGRPIDEYLVPAVDDFSGYAYAAMRMWKRPASIRLTDTTTDRAYRYHRPSHAEYH